MKTVSKLLLGSALLFTTLYATKPVLPDILNPDKTTNPTDIHSTFQRTGPTVQIGILLDTSNSMDGLIDQAKDQLWKIVNEVAKANKHNKEVRIQVGLFEYGKSSLPGYEGYLQMLSPLTDDLDTVSEELFSLRTNGGQEYAGKVILESVNRFVWSSHKDDLKLLIIAGNESFAQGRVPYREAIQKARHNEIIVNTIYCGGMERGRELYWGDGAKLGGGKYFNIDQNDRRVYIETPYDDQIIVLGKKLNTTYMSYGTKVYREAKMANIGKQDTNSMSYSKGSYVERNLVKAKKQYTSVKSDMVDAYMESEAILDKIEADKLPDELQGKSKAEMKKILEEKKQKRAVLQKEIKVLESKRAKFLAEKSSKESDNLGSAIIQSIRKQAKEHGYIFKD